MGGLITVHGCQHSWGGGGWDELYQLLLVSSHEPSTLTCAYLSKTILYPPTAHSGTEPHGALCSSVLATGEVPEDVGTQTQDSEWSPVISPSVLNNTWQKTRGTQQPRMAHSGICFLVVHPQAMVVCQQRCC